SGMTYDKPYKKSARVVGECFVKDTLILTTKGLLPIQDIQIGDLVYTQNGINKVKELYKMPSRKLLKVTLENGLSNIVTFSQKFKVLNQNLEFEWKEATELKNTDYITVKAYYPEVKEFVNLGKLNNKNYYLNENIAYLLGLFISDGWIDKSNNRLCFYSSKKEIIEKIFDIMEKEFEYKATIEVIENKGNTKEGLPFKEGYQIRLNNKGINDFLIETLCLKGFKAITKEIPRQIFHSTSSVIWTFVSGLIDGDGSVHKNRNTIHYGSISEKLINQLIILLQHLGIFCLKYSEEKRHPSFINGREVLGRHKFYFIEFNGINAFRLASNTYLIITDKEKIKRALELQNRTLKKCNYEIIPYAGEKIFNELSKRHLGGGWYKDKQGNKFRMGIKYQTGYKIRYSKDLKKKPLRRSQVIEWNILEKLEKINSPLFDFINQIIENEIYFLKVSYVEEMPASETYDIQVEDEHEFIANGMVSHNCLGKYHPHGDLAVYDTIVRMVQDFS
ncbi:MAG: LAGLIDADG family homing endonuclease, partial [Methanosarcinales archaeon]